MLTKKEHKEFSDLLWNLSKRYPGSSYVGIIYDARKFCKPLSNSRPTSLEMYNMLKKYYHKDDRTMND